VGQSHKPPFWYYYDFGPLAPGTYYHGNSFEMLPLIESETVDMVLIDPPYYMAKDKAWDTFDGKPDYLKFMGQAFEQAQRILKKNGTLGFWHNDLQKIAWLVEWLEENTALRFNTWGVWVKPNHRAKLWKNPGPGNTLRSWFNIAEFCVFFVKATPGTAWNKSGLELVKLDTGNFETLRDYFRRLQQYIGVTKRQIIETCGQAADHCFRWNSSQWMLPTESTYQRITAAYDCGSWPGFVPFDILKEQYDEAVAGYADQIREAEAARFVHNLDDNHCNVWITQEQGGATAAPVPKARRHYGKNHNHPHQPRRAYRGFFRGKRCRWGGGDQKPPPVPVDRPGRKAPGSRGRLDRKRKSAPLHLTARAHKKRNAPTGMGTLPIIARGLSTIIISYLWRFVNAARGQQEGLVWGDKNRTL